jgi:hypothetical protein
MRRAGKFSDSLPLEQVLGFGGFKINDSTMITNHEQLAAVYNCAARNRGQISNSLDLSDLLEHYRLTGVSSRACLLDSLDPARFKQLFRALPLSEKAEWFASLSTDLVNKIFFELDPGDWAELYRSLPVEDKVLWIGNMKYIEQFFEHLAGHLDQENYSEALRIRKDVLIQEQGMLHLS